MKQEDILDNMLKELEKLNLENLKFRKTNEYLRHKYKIIGKKILKEKGLLKYIYHNMKVLKILKMNKLEAKSNGDYEYNCIDDDKKVVIYSAIIGKYDEVEEPVYVPNNCKYILFTDNENIKSEKWEIRPVPTYIKKLKNNILINRYIKMHPHELFKEYDYSVYIDGNIRTISDLRKIVGASETKTGIAMHRHCARNCLYDEAKLCIQFHKGNGKKIVKQIERYKKEKFPKEYGLLECNVIISNLNNENSNEILKEWWKEFEKTESYRDQIALPYTLWKLGYSIKDIGNLGSNVYLNSKIKIEEHK